MTTFTPTPEQQEALRLFRTGDDLKIEACAGSGKTSTLMLLARSTRKSCLYLAFNRAIADEARSTFPKHVQCRTAHSLAFSSHGKGYGERLRGRLLPHQLAQVIGLSSTGSSGVLSAGFISRVLIQSLIKFCQSDDTSFGMAHLPDTLRFENEEDEYAFKRAISPYFSITWTELTDFSSTLSVPHDIYLKQWALSRPRCPARIVFLDEAQDANPLLLGLLQRWQKEGAQIVYVGDRYQQIYSWRGAINAMSEIETLYTVQLTQSFRYGEAIAQVANAVLRHHRKVESQIRGRADVQSCVVEAYEKPEAILCRGNATVISELVHHIDQVKCAIAGGVDDLVKMVEGLRSLLAGERPMNCPELQGFASWRELEEHAHTELGQDLLPLLRLVEEYGVEQLSGLLERVQATPVEEAELYLSTAHKSKGLEWRSVRLADDFPSPVHDEEPNPRWSEEEAHLLYVACTRAREVLDIGSCGAVFDALERASSEEAEASAMEAPDMVSQVEVCEEHPLFPTEVMSLLLSHPFQMFQQLAHQRGCTLEALLEELICEKAWQQGSLF